jgi:nucleotide-binding universal stress UspA family protein
MKRILIALDESPVAEEVLRQASALATATGAKLILFRAVTLPTDLPHELLVEPDRLGEVLTNRARRALERQTIALPPYLIEGTRVAIGAPWQAICEQAKRDDADLIALGAHGYHGLDRLLGTTASKVVNHADRPVLVVRRKPS